MKKRLLSILLALSMMLTILPLNAITAFAADNGTCGNGLTWELSEDGVLTIRGSGAMTNYDDTYNKAPWRENDSSKIRSVAFDGNVTSIGDFAFYQCKNLTEVTIPESVTSIGYDAFGYSGLTSVRIPSSVISVGDYAFQDCSGLNSIDIQNAVIGQRQFYNCKALTTVTIPNTVTTWGEYAFGNCTGLKTVVLANGVTSIGDYAFYNALTTKDDGSTITVTIPDTVTTIGESAFSGCTGLKTIALSSNITAVNRNTFAGSGLTEIAIPSKVTSIGYRAFAQCTSLQEASISDKVTTIDRQAFAGCTSLSTVNIPKGLETIAESTFKNCIALTSITIPTSVRTIGASAFEESGLQHLVIPEGVTGILTDAFKNCHQLIDVEISKTVSDMCTQYSSIFQGCENLQTVKFDKSGTLKILGSDMFNGCTSLSTVVLPNSLSNIRLRVFKGCSSLEKLTLPEGVCDIDESAFENCTKLNEITITYTGTAYVSLDTNAFKGCSKLEKIYYTGSLNNLKKFGTRNIIGLIGLNTGDTQIQYDGQEPIDLVYQCRVRFYTQNSNNNQYEYKSKDDISVYRKETVAKSAAPDMPSKNGYTLSWRVGSADGEEFKFDETPVPSDLSLYAVYTLDTKGVTVSAGVTVKVPGAADVVSDGTTPVQVKPNTEITLEAPELADGDAYEWTHGDSVVTENNSNEYTFTVAGDTTIKLSTLKALHITEGKPNITGTKYDATSDTYYGNGWEYSKNAGLTIKADKNLSEEPAVTVKVTVASGVTVFNAYLKGEVTNNGTLTNCVFGADATLNGTGTITNSLFGAKPNDATAKTLTEADGKNITAKLDGVKDGSLTGTELWFVGSPKLTVKVDSDPATEIKHINHKSVNETDNYDGVTGTVAIDSTEHSVTFTPDGNDNILLNNRTAVTGDFTFTTPDDCSYDGKAHKVTDITSTTYNEDEYTVKYEYKKPGWQEGDEVKEVTEAKNAGTYTVKIVMRDGQTIDTGKSFTISPAEPSADDFTVVKNPNGVTEDRDDSEKTMKVALKSDSLFNETNSNVTKQYQKKNASGEWKDVTAPSGKGEYRLVATVTTTDPNLTGGTVTWEFTILDREDASWLEMTVEDGKITKVVRPAADDAEEDITEKVLLTASADGSKTAYRVPAGAAVTVTANDAPQDMKFEMWRFSVNSMNGDTVLALYSRSMTFTMKDDLAGLTVSAMYQDAAIDSGYDILGPAAAATTVVVGSAVLAYQGHQLGTELYLIYLLPSGAVIPANRIQLALLLWQDAGNPAPVDETPYSDIGADDTDAMQAAQWAVETGLMDLPDPDSAPDQFDPYTAVSNVDVIHAWKKAQKVKG